MNENKVKVWLARDKDESLCLYGNPTTKDDVRGIWTGNGAMLGTVNKLKFPSISWEDNEPTEAYITLAEPQEQPKQEIDWEQRRYEIAKEMILEFYRQRAVVNGHGLRINLKDIADLAVTFADVLINKLKEQGK